MEGPKTPDASRCIMTELVLPNDTNAHDTLFGGRLLSLMDKAAAITAMRHAGMVCVTVAVDSVEFQSPINLGDVITLEAWVNRTFRTSLEVEIVVHAEDHQKKGEEMRRQCNHAYFTFVAVGPDGKSAPVPEITPTTEEEKRRYEGAALRREIRLHLKGKLSLTGSTLMKDEVIAAISGRDLS